MLGTGGSVTMAVKVLKEYGVNPENIVFVNVVGCEVGIVFTYSGLRKLTSEFPGVTIITASIDPLLLDNSKYLAPGIGDFGDRYFATLH